MAAPPVSLGLPLSAAEDGIPNPKALPGQLMLDAVPGKLKTPDGQELSPRRRRPANEAAAGGGISSSSSGGPNGSSSSSSGGDAGGGGGVPLKLNLPLGGGMGPTPRPGKREEANAFSSPKKMRHEKYHIESMPLKSIPQEQFTPRATESPRRPEMPTILEEDFDEAWMVGKAERAFERTYYRVPTPTGAGGFVYCYEIRWADGSTRRMYGYPCR